MNKISADLVQQSEQKLNPIGERQLSMTALKIAAIENLGATQDHFDCIDLSDNEIKKLGNFSVLQRISKVMSMGESLPNLQNLSLINNKLAELQDLDNLSDCKNLERLILFNNMVTQAPNYRLYVISRIPSLKILDFKKVKKSEREEAKKLFNFQEKKNEEESKLSKKDKIKKLIESAKTLEEVNRIELLLKSSELGSHVFEKTLSNFKLSNI